ncbi:MULTISPECIES: hypothetical protein [Geobacillus]|uniref:Uncharacterized protein n=1 Tax=Geobacillus thermodenitrificans TaxID=33940 RepID=A0ABY9QDX6_GEOTD|nr:MULTISPECIES: hypothetical protein [Geobacillus]QNU30603.1 hypothetical protein IC804_14370 [Geobacillus sp. 47C-IIb]WMV77105.1 hypothetical protein HSX42_04820 [Geobacillus thermodenitrificans]
MKIRNRWAATLTETNENIGRIAMNGEQYARYIDGDERKRHNGKENAWREDDNGPNFSCR